MFDLANKASVCHLRVAAERHSLYHTSFCPLLHCVVSLIYSQWKNTYANISINISAIWGPLVAEIRSRNQFRNTSNTWKLICSLKCSISFINYLNIFAWGLTRGTALTPSSYSCKDQCLFKWQAQCSVSFSNSLSLHVHQHCSNQYKLIISKSKCLI